MINAFYSVETNGTLKVSGLIDYETYDSNFSFIVFVLDDQMPPSIKTLP